MRSGKLIHRVTIQQNQKVKDGVGQFSDQWVDVITTYASVEATTGSREEFAVGAGRTSDVTYKVITRYSRSLLLITNDMQILYEDRPMDVQTISDTKGTKEELTITCLQRNQGR